MFLFFFFLSVEFQRGLKTYKLINVLYALEMVCLLAQIKLEGYVAFQKTSGQLNQGEGNRCSCIFISLTVISLYKIV